MFVQYVGINLANVSYQYISNNFDSNALPSNKKDNKNKMGYKAYMRTS